MNFTRITWTQEQWPKKLPKTFQKHFIPFIWATSVSFIHSKSFRSACTKAQHQGHVPSLEWHWTHAPVLCQGSVFLLSFLAYSQDHSEATMSCHSQNLGHSEREQVGRACVLAGIPDVEQGIIDQFLKVCYYVGCRDDVQKTCMETSS